MPLGTNQNENESKLNEISAYNNVLSSPITSNNAVVASKNTLSSTRRNFQNDQKIE